jgi:ribosomal protein L35AE/L33A
MRYLGNILQHLQDKQFVITRLRLIKGSNNFAAFRDSKIKNGTKYVVIEVLKASIEQELKNLVGKHVIHVRRSRTLGKCPECRDSGKVARSGSGGLELIKANEMFRSDQIRNAQLQSCTVCVVKPHALIEKKLGPIVQDIIDNGYEISDLELVHLDVANAEEFLEVYRGIVPEYNV